MKERSFIAGVIAGIVVCAAVAWSIWKLQTPKSEPNLAPLHNQVQAAAEKAFPLPSLGARTIEIPPGHADVEQRITGIIALTQQMGGTAMRGLERDNAAVVLATIPQGASENFAALVSQWPIPPVEPASAAPSASETVDCEIVLKRANN